MKPELVKDIIQWDIKTWSAALNFWEQTVNWNNVHSCLELGGREGGLSLWVALKGKKVICSDLSETERTARPLHQKHGVEGLITYEDIDATAIPYVNHFDVILFKSIMGGIGRDAHGERQSEAFAQMHKSLKPGGKLLFAENLKASPIHQYLRRKFVRWGNSWNYLTVNELQQGLKVFSGAEIKTSGFTSAFGRNEWQQNFFSLADRFLFNHITPEEWHYVSYGIATK